MDDGNLVLPVPGRALRRETSAAAGKAARPRHRIRPATYRFGLQALDAALVGTIAIAVGFPAKTGAGATHGAVAGAIVVVLLAIAVTVLSLWHSGAYSIESGGPRPSAVVSGWLNACGLLILAISLLAALGVPVLSRGPPAGVFASGSLPIFLAVSGTALLARHALWLALRRRLAPLTAGTAAVVGVGPALLPLAEMLREREGMDEVVAVASDLDGSIEQVMALVRRGAVETVFVVVSPTALDEAQPLLGALKNFPVAVRIVPDVTAIAARSRGISVAAGLPVFHIAEPPLTPAAAVVKRAEDIVVATLLLIAAAPVMLLASIAIKLESSGPVLFRQPRQGLRGALIEVLKFRTMYCQFEDRHASRQTAFGDPRVTRVGRLLRRHSLDELPQLFNVLAGSMSLIGPRPHALETTAAGQLLDKAVANYMARHKVKPGITGWAQVSGCRGQLDSVEKAVRRVTHDLYYIDNWSLLFDLRIIMRTVALVVHDDAAF